MKVCILIQVLLACLAILSRIHFSKYKAEKLKGLMHIREEVQKIRVITKKEAELLIRKRMQQMISISIMILFVSTCIAEVVLWNDTRQSGKTDMRVLERDDYDGEVKTEDIRLSVDDKEYTYTMEI